MKIYFKGSITRFPWLRFLLTISALPSKSVRFEGLPGLWRTVGNNHIHSNPDP